MKIVNTISNRIQLVISNFRNRIAKTVLVSNNIDELDTNETDANLFQINKQEEEFLFI